MGFYGKIMAIYGDTLAVDLRVTSNGPIQNWLVVQ